MQAKSLFLAAALIALPTATAFAQAASQPAPMDNSSPAPSSADTAQPSAAQPSAGQAAPTVPATLADLTVGAVVNDPAGAKVGSIVSATSAGAVVSTGTARAQIPIASFAKNAQGLTIGITKTDLEAAVAKAAPPKS